MRSLSETLPKQYSTRGLVLRRAPAERLTTSTWQPPSASMLVSRLPMKPAPPMTTIRSPGNDSALLVSQERKGAIRDHLAGLDDRRTLSAIDSRGTSSGERAIKCSNAGVHRQILLQVGGAQLGRPHGISFEIRQI